MMNKNVYKKMAEEVLKMEKAFDEVLENQDLSSETTENIEEIKSEVIRDNVEDIVSDAKKGCGFSIKKLMLITAGVTAGTVIARKISPKFKGFTDKILDKADDFINIAYDKIISDINNESDDEVIIIPEEMEEI